MIGLVTLVLLDLVFSKSVPNLRIRQLRRYNERAATATMLLCPGSRPFPRGTDSQQQEGSPLADDLSMRTG